MSFDYDAENISIGSFALHYLLSLFEVLLERVGEALRIFDELALPLLEGLLAGAARDVARDLVHRVQQLLYGARDFPAKDGEVLGLGNNRKERRGFDART